MYDEEIIEIASLFSKNFMTQSLTSTSLVMSRDSRFIKREVFSQRSYVATICNGVFGNCLKNKIFLPLNNQSIPSSEERSCKEIFNPDIPDAQYLNKKEVLEAFEHTEGYFTVNLGENVYQIAYHHFASKCENAKKHISFRIGGNQENKITALPQIYPFLAEHVQSNSETHLSFFHVSLYDNYVKKGNDVREKWVPEDELEIGNVFLELLRSMKQKNQEVDSLICHSLGSIVFDALQKNQHSLDDLPKSIILDRAMTSLWKTGRKLYPCVVAFILYSLAELTHWSADPEQSLLNFFRAQSISEIVRLLLLKLNMIIIFQELELLVLVLIEI